MKAMKTGGLLPPAGVVVGLILLIQSSGVVNAQDTSAVPAVSTAPAAAVPQVKLSAAVSDVLQLVRAHVGDETILAFIDSRSASYSLSSADILYLHGQGVSERVLTAMLNRPKIAVEAAPQAASQTAPAPPATSAEPQPGTQQAPAPAVAPAAPPAYVAPATTYVAPTTVYVPYTAPTYYVPAYYYGYPSYPAVSLSFGFGFGGWHGGYYHGGGHYGHH